MSRFVTIMIELLHELSAAAVSLRLSHTSLEADPGTVADPILDLPAGDKAQLRDFRRFAWRRHQGDFSAAV